MTRPTWPRWTLFTVSILKKKKHIWCDSQSLFFDVYPLTGKHLATWPITMLEYVFSDDFRSSIQGIFWDFSLYFISKSLLWFSVDISSQCKLWIFRSIYVQISIQILGQQFCLQGKFGHMTWTLFSVVNFLPVIA